ncbi:MAG: hypothetical protein JST81_11580 [Bacteroidetes bacterium]|nr:hypothetical protein [Bacteroidota bacterium]
MKENFKQVTLKKKGHYGVVSFSGKIIVPVLYESVVVLNDYLPGKFLFKNFIHAKAS